VIVKVPEISQVVTIDVCFQTPHGKKVVELPFHKFHRQKLDHGWVTAAAAAGAFALPNDGESCVVQSIRMRLTGTGNIYFGKVVVGYSNKNFVLPEDIAAKTQICPKICEATE
ncbi:MAG TPA: hypothetical protein VIS99_05580, partial [Terrimicrobiaceae bacterium]